MRRSTDIAHDRVGMIRSGSPAQRFGLADGSSVMPCCISDFDVFQHSLEDSREFYIHVILPTASIGKSPGRSAATLARFALMFSKPLPRVQRSGRSMYGPHLQKNTIQRG